MSSINSNMYFSKIFGLSWLVAIPASVFFTLFANSSYYASVVLFFLIIIAFLTNFNLGARFYIFSILVTSDVTVEPLNGKKAIISHSLNLDAFDGVSLLTLLTSITLFLCLLFLMSSKNKVLINKSILLLIFLPLFVPLYGFILNPFSIALSDSSQFIGFLVGFFVCYLSKIEAREVIKLFFLAIISVMFFNVILFVENGFALLYYGYIGNLFPIVFLMLDYIGRRKGVVFFSLALINLIIFPGRSRLAGYIYAISCKSIFSSNLRQLITLITFSALAIFIISYLLPFFKGAEVYFLWKLTSFFGSGNDSLSSYIRLLELKNIMMLNFTHLSNFFVGSGYGACFTDRYYPFPFGALATGSSYPADQVASKCYVKPHTNLAVLLLKSGMLLGVVFFMANLTLVYGRLRKIITSRAEFHVYKILYYIPFWIFVSYNQSSFIVYGAFIYLLNLAFTRSTPKQY